MIRMTLEIEDDMTWGDLKRWITAVEASGTVADDTKILVTNEQYSEVQYLQVEL